MSRATILLAIASLLLGQSQGDTCFLHENLVSVGQWETKISRTGRMKEVFIRFGGDYMNETMYGPTGEDEITRECLKSFSDNKYVFSWQERGEKKFQCRQLIPVNKNIVILKTSTVFHEQSTAELHCLGHDPLEFYDWPLLATKRSVSEVSLCGLEGGFEFYTKLTDDMTFCREPDKSIKPKLEVGCSNQKEQGIELDFRNFICKGMLEFKLQQKLTCLGNWKRGGYTFSVVTDSAELLPKLWLLRFDKDSTLGVEFDIQIFPDIMMDMKMNPESTQVRHVHTLVTKRNDFADVCIDEANPITCNRVCSINSGDIEEEIDIGLPDVFCMKSCGKCPHDQGECNFSNNVRGSWNLKEGGVQRHVVLTNSILYEDAETPMKCLNLSGSVGDKQPVVSFFRNGCKPQYRCAHLKPRGPNVMQYHLSDTIIWPYKNDLSTADICAEETDDSLQIAVKEISRESVYCGIEGVFHFTGQRYRSNNEAACSGFIRACEFKNIFRMEYSAGCQRSNEEFTCIASYYEGSSRFLVTESEDSSEIRCWVAHENPVEQRTAMYELTLETCHAHVINDIKRDDTVAYNMKYWISGHLEMMDALSCNRVPKTDEQPVIFTTSSANTSPFKSYSEKTLEEKTLGPNALPIAGTSVAHFHKFSSLLLALCIYTVFHLKM